MSLLGGANVLLFHGSKGEEVWESCLQETLDGLKVGVNRITEGPFHLEKLPDLFRIFDEKWFEVVTHGVKEGEANDIFMFMPDFTFDPVESVESLKQSMAEYEKFMVLCATHSSHLFIHFVPLVISLGEDARALASWLLSTYSSLLSNVVVCELYPTPTPEIKDFFLTEASFWLRHIPQEAGLPSYAYRARG